MRRPSFSLACIAFAALLGAALPGSGLPLPAATQASPNRPPKAGGPSIAPPGRALLIRGPEPRRGLPFFSPNAIPCLYGEYLVGTELLPLYYTRADLVLSESWRAPAGQPWSLPSSGLQVSILQREGSQILLLAAASYRLFLVLPGDATPYRRFALALERRFAFFFDNAQSDAELSFPASVDFSP